MRFIFFLVLSSLNLYAGTFQLSSDVLNKKDSIPLEYALNKYGCQGENKSPSLFWKHVPKNTKSFALTVFDPDATSGSGWWHWIVYNIPKNVKKLSEGASQTDKMPIGSKESLNDFGFKGWGGPCPPKGETHHYTFTLYALKSDDLDLGKNPTNAQLGEAIQKKFIKKSIIRIKFGR
jgi:Raf kinase inhibitor-like YbhB/YbcL family protein